MIGDAGIGKTRLVADLEEEARELGFAWTWVENLSYTTGESYGFARTFAQRLADEAGIDSGAFARRLLFSDDIDEDQARRYAGGIALIAREAAFSGWEAEANLAPTDPAQIQFDLGEVAERYMRRLAVVGGPRALVIDDLHWMDASSAPLVDRLLRTVADVPVIVFVTTRPRTCPPGPKPIMWRRSRSKDSMPRARNVWPPRSPARSWTMRRSTGSTAERPAIHCSSARRSGRSSRTTHSSLAVAGSACVTPTASAACRSTSAPSWGPASTACRRARAVSSRWRPSSG